MPLYRTASRVTRHHILLSVLVVGVVLAIIPTAEASEEVAKQAIEGSDGRSLMFKDWTVLGDLPDGPGRIDREQHRQAEYFRRWKAVHEMVGHQHTSRLSQELLARRGLGPALLEKGANLDGRSFDGIDTLRVLIVRIGFESNRDSNLTTVAPGGDFDLTPPANLDTLLVDPAPHNRDFYQSHLVGLSEYYNYQSGGRLHIEGTVLPEGQDDSYKLSDVADYGPGSDGFWTIESLEALVRDMILAGDQGTLGTEHDFSLHDDDDPFTYIIFVHAGSDWQSDINGDSPNDIPTFFVALGEPQALAGGGMLSECSVIPETTTQDGYPGSIAAAFYHEFGHALGLVDVYNTTTGYPSVGIWDLMDSGTNLPVTLGHITAQNDTIIQSATGVLPPSLGVWNKWFLGWVEMDEADGRDEDYRLPAVQIPRDQYGVWDAGNGDFDLSYPQALRVGASPREYFLLENRYVPPAPDETGTYTPYQALLFEKDDDTNVIQYLTGLRGSTWSNSGMYDYFMPDGGLLVWHINMDRIRENLLDNTINAFGDGIRLVEADGIQDIGVVDAYVLGWYGSVRDPFNENNGFDAFGEGSSVTSRLYDRSWSGVSLTDIRNNGSRSASVMRFGARIEPLESGFPWQSISAAEGGGGPRRLDTRSLTPLEFSNGSVLLFSDAPGQGVDEDDFLPSIYAVDASGDTPYTSPVGRPQGSALALDAPLAGAPLALSEAGDNYRLVHATRDGTLGLSVIGGTSSFAPVFSTTVSDTILAGPVLVEDDEGNLLAAVHAAGDTLVFWDLATGSVVDRVRTMNPTRGLPIRVPNDDEIWVGIPTDLGLNIMMASPLSSNATYHWQREVYGTVHLALVDGEMPWAFDDRGFLQAGDPMEWAFEALPGLDEPLVCEPAVADLDGDGHNDMIVATATHIFAFSRAGIALTGWPCRLYDLFPLDEDTRLAGPLVVADVTGDGVNEVLFNTTGGHLMGLDATARLLPNLPFKWGDEGRGGLALATDGNGGTILWMVSPGGYATEPFARNHINGRVMASGWGPTASSDDRTSQWLGVAGGPLRTGPTGTARDLGALAPLAAEMDRALLYPNPIHDTDLTVRFYAHGDDDAHFILYNLEGEEIARETIPVTAAAVNEHQMDVSGIVSGLYLGRLVYPGEAGTETRTMTLAVER